MAAATKIKVPKEIKAGIAVQKNSTHSSFKLPSKTLDKGLAWHAMKAIWNRDKPGLGSLEADAVVGQVDISDGTVYLQGLC